MVGIFNTRIIDLAFSIFLPLRLGSLLDRIHGIAALAYALPFCPHPLTSNLIDISTHLIRLPSRTQIQCSRTHQCTLFCRKEPKVPPVWRDRSELKLLQDPVLAFALDQLPIPCHF